MINKVQEYVESLEHSVRTEIIADYEQFMDTGVTGDTAVRIHALELGQRLNIDENRVVLCMQMLAMECYRFYANLYLESI